MRCEQASKLMSQRLDDQLNDQESTRLENHIAACDACQAEWHRVQSLDRLFSAAPMVPAPPHLSKRVAVRIKRREQARRAIIGGAALMLGTVALALLVLAPAFLGLLDNLGIAPALISGGPETLVQVFALLGTLVRVSLVLLEQFGLPLAILGLGSLMVALALNGLWIGALRRSQVVH
jgi:predicted anti-sigma-YlaC factor YlaD